MARTLILLFARALPAQTASGKDANGAGQAAFAPPPQSGGIEVLSDTNGVDLGPYRKDLKHDVKEHWYKLANAIAPQSERLKKGTVAIEFTVGRDGAVLGMRIVATAGEVVLDRAAWGESQGPIPFDRCPRSTTERHSCFALPSCTTRAEVGQARQASRSAFHLPATRRWRLEKRRPLPQRLPVRKIGEWTGALLARAVPALLAGK